MGRCRRANLRAHLPDHPTCTPCSRACSTFSASTACCARCAYPHHGGMCFRTHAFARTHACRGPRQRPSNPNALECRKAAAFRPFEHASRVVWACSPPGMLTQAMLPGGCAVVPPCLYPHPGARALFPAWRREHCRRGRWGTRTAGRNQCPATAWKETTAGRGAGGAGVAGERRVWVRRGAV